MTMPSLTGLSNQGKNKTDKYSAKNTIRHHSCLDKDLFYLITEDPVSRWVPPHPQGEVEGGQKPGGRSRWYSKPWAQHLLWLSLPELPPQVLTGFHPAPHGHWFSYSTQFLQMEISVWTEYQILIWTGFQSSRWLCSVFGSRWVNPTYSMPPDSLRPASPGQDLWT